MKRQLFTLIILLACTALYAKQYPDSVCAASDAEYRIEQGLNIDISGGFGFGGFGFTPMFGHRQADAHTLNANVFPLWNGAIGINYYFLPWLGVGTGAQLSNYANKSSVVWGWDYSATDAQGDKYTFTAKPVGIEEKQEMYMLEIPLNVRFRVIERNVGFHGAIGVKFGVPVKDYYRSSGGTIQNQVYYPDFDLLLDKNIPGVLEDITVNATQQKITGLNKLNCGAYAEIGMLFRLHQRIDLMLAVAGTYYLNDVMKGATANPLGFNDPSLPTDYYPSPFTSAYNGVLSSNEVQQLHPWSLQLKLGLSINAGQTVAKHAYDDPEWGAHHAECEAKRAAKKNAKNAPAEEPAPVVEPVPEPVVEPVVEPEPVPAAPDTEAIEKARAAEEAAKAAKAAEEKRKAEEAAKAAAEEAKRIEEQRDAEAITHTKVTAYKLNSHELSEESKAELDHAAQVLAKHPNWTIEVRGHCCDLGSERANNRIGQERANEAKKYLVKQGVDESRITATCMGSTQPLVPNDSPEHRALNRRVEIVINK